MTYRFEVRVTRPASSKYLYDGVDAYVTTIEADDAADALARLGSFKLVVVPESLSDTEAKQ